MASLPLFPLGTVLLPGARLSLQVFEPRYVSLLRDLIEGQDERPPVFGIIAIREGNEVGEGAVRALHDVGCAALLTHVAALGGQRFFIIVNGTDRFRVGEIDRLAGTPYTTARVHWLDEQDGDASVVGPLADRLRAELMAFREMTGDDDQEIPDDARALSYAVPRVVSLVRRDNFIVVQANVHNRRDEVQKIFDAIRVERVDGYWTVLEMRMADSLQRTRTELVLEKVEYDVGLRPDDFSRRELERR